MKVLWIPGWYPNQTEPFTGDFVQRHAKAVSLYHEVTVLFITRDAKGAITRDIKVEEFAQGMLLEKKIYYYSHITRPSSLSRALSYRKYLSLLKSQVKKYIAENGRPDLIHFYIGMKTGVIGNWIKKLGIPYVVSEQWTGFLPEGKPHFSDLPVLFQSRWKSLIMNAAGVHAVSSYLGTALQRLVKDNLQPKIIPNVVDTGVFFQGRTETGGPLKLVHVTSELDYQKNTEDIFQALALLKQKGIQFYLDVFGTVKPMYPVLASRLGIKENITFHGEKSQDELASYFRQAAALIIYSRYETFGCVVIEAMACGTPVVASDMPVFHEIIEEKKNGVFARGEDPAALAEKISWLLENKDVMDKVKTAEECAERYNYERVGKIFSDWYVKTLALPGL